jgi:GNAT superfamily N-acetyltransferase
VGRVLVERALRWAGERGVERCEVRVATRNREGQGFWRSLGFGDLMDVLQRPL